MDVGSIEGLSLIQLKNKSLEDIITDVSDFRHKSTTYKVGDKVECMFNHELWFECTVGGTTSATPLDTSNVTHGQVLTDGTVQWTVQTHVRSINGVAPDESGNVNVPTYTHPNSGVVAGAYNSVTVNEQGHVTAGTNNPIQAFPSGTQILFYQSAAPTGWTRVAGLGGQTVHIVSDDSGGGAGGALNFWDVFKWRDTNWVETSGTVGAKNISVSQLAKHSHSLIAAKADSGTKYGLSTWGGDDSYTVGYAMSTGSDGSHTHTFSGSSHAHSVNLSVKYINVIVCRKD